MGDVKLSERIRSRKREYWADSDDMFRSGFERARLGYVADGLEEAARIVEQHEHRLESTNAELTKRVAELEDALSRERDVSSIDMQVEREMRDATIGDLKAQLEAKDRRVAELEEQLKRVKSANGGES